jgi:hypothetical protein
VKKLYLLLLFLVLSVGLLVWDQYGLPVFVLAMLMSLVAMLGGMIAGIVRSDERENLKNQREAGMPLPRRTP